MDELSTVKDKIKNFENTYLKKDNNLLENIVKEILKDQLDNINNKLEKENANLKKDINLLRDELKIRKEENQKINEEIKNLKQEVNKLKNAEKKDINSAIIKENEFSFIKMEIEKRMKNQIKSIKKLYRATIDGGEPKNFHLKCDNIPNTLTLIESERKRRFGGFTSLCWESSEIDNAKYDEKAFLFNLDKKEIYPVKSFKDAIRCKKEWGPCFGRGKDIGIEGNPIKSKELRAFQASYNYNGNQNCISEDSNYNGIYAKDYEVFQIIFE